VRMNEVEVPMWEIRSQVPRRSGLTIVYIFSSEMEYINDMLLYNCRTSQIDIVLFALA